MDKALVYGRVGYRYLDGTLSGDGDSIDEQFNGLRLGLGADVEVAKNIHARADFSYTMYDDYSKDGLTIEPPASKFHQNITRVPLFDVRL